MAQEFAIGLFRTLGTAQDARARLVHEGVPPQDIALRRLSPEAVIPPEDTPQTMVSFMDWLFGMDLTERYGVEVHNGETVLCVRTQSEDATVTALEILQLFVPLRLERVPAPEAADSGLRG